MASEVRGEVAVPPIERLIAFLIDVLPMVPLEAIPVGGPLIATTYLLFRDAMFKGQSVGKKLLKTRVVLRSSGEPASIRETILRNFPLALNFFLPIIPVIGHLVGAGFAAAVVLTESIAVVTDPRGRRLGDKFAGTIVVRDRPLRAQHG